MKKQYIIAVLLLIGAATVSTMAFSTSSTTVEDFNIYDITPSAGDITVSNVRIRVINSDVAYVKISLANGGAGTLDGRIHITFTDEASGQVNLNSDMTVTYDISDTTPGALTTAATQDTDVVLVVDVDAVHATDDYILLKLDGTGIIYDAGTGDLASMTISAYDVTDVTVDAAHAYTEAEASVY